ncbi:MAG TPA: EAL domain-containing protein [Abditibacteriaceae bacterium]|jgi:diguanylate cyclase (GGDEF)-like protein/PAS domain S-box-containing protein
MTALQTEPDGVEPWWAHGAFRSLIDDVLDIVAIIEMDGRFVFVNEAVTRVLGWKPAELTGTNSFALLHPDDRARIAALVGQPNPENEGELHQARYQHRDGSWRSLESRGKRTEDNGRVVITARDITQRLEAEAALRDSQKRLQSVVNNAPVIIWAFDRDGIYTFSDGKGLRELDATPGAIVGKSIFETARSPEILEAANRALRGEEFSFVSHVGERTYATRYAPLHDDDGEFRGTIGVANDITDRWKVEQQTRLQASILDEIPQGAIVIDRQFRISYWNRAAEQMLGWQREEIMGRDVRELLSRDTNLRVEIDKAARRVFEGATWEGEPQLIRRDGSYFPAHITKTPMRDADGQITGLISIVQDITERRNAELALRASEERYALAASGSNAGLWDWDLKADRIYFSDRWKAMLGYSPEAISDSPDEWFNRIHPNETEFVRTKLDEHLHGYTPAFEVEYRILHEDSTYRWMSASGVAVNGTDGTSSRIAGSQTDVTERKVAEEQLLQSAFYDTLTGLPNRALFTDRLERMLARARRADYHFALLFLDLDRFKNVNDSLGHGSGDQLLVRVTQRLESCVRANDTFARLGGDEFAVLLDDVRDIRDATQLAERMQNELIAPLSVDGHDIFVSVSIGIASSKREISDGENESESLYRLPEEMLRDADTAMYRAKSLGKARHEIFNRAMHTRAFEMLKLESDLRRAIERDELETHYQPLISLAHGNLVGFEALVRWRHPERGLVPPGDFIPIAEDSGLILPLGEWVLRDVCAQMRKWHDTGLVEGCCPAVAVNISSRQFSQTQLVSDVRSILDEFRIQPCDIKLEITESVIMENRESAAVMLHELKTLGVHLSIDDFGTGYSSLASLYQFPLSTLKIDRSFIQRLGDDGQNAEIVRTILLLARNLDMSVIAEGIETASQFSLLRALGCDCGQGYLFSRPLPVEQAQKLISAPPLWWQVQNPS